MITKRKIAKYLLLFISLYIGYSCVLMLLADSDNSDHHHLKRPYEYKAKEVQGIENTKTQTQALSNRNIQQNKLYSSENYTDTEYTDTEPDIGKTSITTKECPNALIIHNFVKDIIEDEWVTVNQDIHIFSAYSSGQNAVKITGMSSAKRINVFCQLYYGHVKSKLDVLIVAASYSIIPETHGFRYVPVIYRCSTPQEIVPLLIGVSLVEKKCDNPRRYVPVHVKPLNWKPTYNFTVCPAPLNREYDKLGEFLQYVEVNGMFGADRFVFYNHSVSKRLDPFINYYIETGVAEIVQWRIPVETKQGVTNQIHYFGQVVAQAECVLRASMNSRYVVGLDLDELIVPMQATNWLSIIGTNKNIGAYLFPNIFFRKEWEQDGAFQANELMQKYPIDALLYTKREPKIWPHGQRSKYIARPDVIEVVGIHTPFKMKPGFKLDYVSSDKGILAHYRNWEDFSRSEKKVEKRMHVFSSQILERISKIILKVENQK